MTRSEGIKFLREGELAQRWRIHVATLQRYRYQGIGPQYVKIGGRVLYPVEALEAFEAQHLNTPPGHISLGTLGDEQ